ncbi:MAG: type II toxin-antitoxin system VapC family toxin [Pirellulaceae bacterium]|nr:type II toxin-antitoxin system VapC family toxin [Pirellulaceae bacterium]
MKLLLDTHAFFWFIADHQSLSSTGREMISDAGNEIFLSPATYWEIAIKVSLGKWILNRPYQELIDIAVVKYGFQILPILSTHTERLLNLPFHHRDPFDRLLVAHRHDVFDLEGHHRQRLARLAICTTTGEVCSNLPPELNGNVIAQRYSSVLMRCKAAAARALTRLSSSICFRSMSSSRVSSAESLPSRFRDRRSSRSDWFLGAIVMAASADRPSALNVSVTSFGIS